MMRTADALVAVLVLSCAWSYYWHEGMSQHVWIVSWAQSLRTVFFLSVLSAFHMVLYRDVCASSLHALRRFVR